MPCSEGRPFVPALVASEIHKQISAENFSAPVCLCAYVQGANPLLDTFLILKQEVKQLFFGYLFLGKQEHEGAVVAGNLGHIFSNGQAIRL